VIPVGRRVEADTHVIHGRLSASTPWKSRGYADMIRESMRAEVDFPEGPFRGVSEERTSGCRNLAEKEREDRLTLVSPNRSSENVRQIPPSTRSVRTAKFTRGTKSSCKPPNGAQDENAS